MQNDETYDRFVDEFHQIVEQEHVAHGLLLTPDAALAVRGELMEFMFNTTAAGLLSEDFVEPLVSRLNKEAHFRKIWMSIGTRVEHLLAWRYAKSHTVFIQMVRETLIVDLPPEGQQTFTSVTLLQERPGMKLHDMAVTPLDMWLYCAAFFRLTIGNSAMYHEQIELAKARPPERSRQKQDRTIVVNPG